MRRTVLDAMVGFAWDQWAQLGVAGHAPAVEEPRVADPEALLLFTLRTGRHDPRLFDEVLDWWRLNQSLVSVHRLRRLSGDPTTTALMDAALGWVGDTGRAVGSRHGAGGAGPPLEPLFAAVPQGGERDPWFAAAGFERPPLRASERSSAPDPARPIALTFRLRHLLGLGVRAEVVRALLTIRAPAVSTRTLAATAAFSARNVREALGHLVAAGVAIPVDRGRAHTVPAERWAWLLGLPDAPSLPLHYDWIPVLGALGAVADHLLTPDPAGRSPYLQASAIGELLTTVGPDLLAAGVRVPSRREVVAAPDPWVLLGGAMTHAVDVISGRIDRRAAALGRERVADT